MIVHYSAISRKIIVQGNMYVDNEVFTLDDWALFVNV
jgi:hypothetical protein